MRIPFTMRRTRSPAAYLALRTPAHNTFVAGEDTDAEDRGAAPHGVLHAGTAGAGVQHLHLPVPRAGRHERSVGCVVDAGAEGTVHSGGLRLLTAKEGVVGRGEGGGRGAVCGRRTKVQTYGERSRKGERKIGVSRDL